jgi:hypothetical protein
MTEAIPSLEEFLAWPVDAIVPLAPATVIYVPGGTRRAAALAGIAVESAAYVQESRRQLIAAVAELFQHGVRHVIMNAIVPANWAEQGRFRQMLEEWVRWVIDGDAAREDYARLGCGVRLLTDLPALDPIAAAFAEADPGDAAPTLWWQVVTDRETPWRWALTAAAEHGARTQAEAIRALYGRALPPAELLIGFGKPQIEPGIIPPLLVGEMACYWVQRPGYWLPTRLLRRMLYDLRYRRRTWVADKTGRAEEGLPFRSVWEQERILGEGRRLGPHWYMADES